MPISIKLEKISPKQAEKYLERNENNRPLSELTSDRYAAIMARGAWELNAETVKFNCNGRLIDGQHRLKGIIKSGKTVEMHVARGLPEKAFDSIDQGKKRNLGDVFARAGEMSYTTLAGAVNWCNYLINCGRYEARGMEPDQGKAFLAKNPELRQSVAASLHHNLRNLMPQGLGAALHYMFSRKDKVLAESFIEALGSGESLKKTDPVYLLRERLIRNKTDQAKIGYAIIAALAIKAWNATRSGQSIRVLKMIADEEMQAIK